jgi:hypothetical protein
MVSCTGWGKVRGTVRVRVMVRAKVKVKFRSRIGLIIVPVLTLRQGLGQVFGLTWG